jgi:hypothetical protein
VRIAGRSRGGRAIWTGGRKTSGPWQRRSFVFASIAASLFAVLGSVLGWQNHRLRQELRLSEMRVAELGAKAPSELAQASRLKESANPAAVSRFEPTSQKSEPAPLSAIAMTLVPGLSRSIVPTRESSVELTPTARSLALSHILDEGADSEGNYSATIEGASGKILYSVDALKSVSSTDAKRIVTFTVPTRALAAGGYIVRLRRTTATAGLEVVNDYRLFVVKRESMDSTEQRVGTLALTNDTGTAGTITVAGRSAKSDDDLWESVRRCNSIECHELYISLFPAGQHADEAGAAIAALKARGAGAVAAAPQNEARLRSVIERFAKSFSDRDVRAVKRIFPRLPDGLKNAITDNKVCRSYVLRIGSSTVLRDEPDAAWIKAETSYDCKPQTAQGDRIVRMSEVFGLRRLPEGWVIDSIAAVDQR